MQKWEYTSTRDEGDKLNDLGREGWEAYAASEVPSYDGNSGSTDTLVMLKRPLVEPEPTTDDPRRFTLAVSTGTGSNQEIHGVTIDKVGPALAAFFERRYHATPHKLDDPKRLAADAFAEINAMLKVGAAWKVPGLVVERTA